jgi:hypothetical protein
MLKSLIELCGALSNIVVNITAGPALTEDRQVPLSRTVAEFWTHVFTEVSSTHIASGVFRQRRPKLLSLQSVTVLVSRGSVARSSSSVFRHMQRLNVQ